MSNIVASRATGGAGVVVYPIQSYSTSSAIGPSTDVSCRTLSTVGAITSAGNVNVTGNVTATAVNASTLASSAGTSVGGNLTVTGSATTGALTATSANVAGTVLAGTLSGTTLGLTGAATIGGAINGSSTVSGTAANFSSSVTTPAVSAGTVSTTGNVTVGGNLIVTGTFTPSSTVTALTVDTLAANTSVTTPTLTSAGAVITVPGGKHLTIAGGTLTATNITATAATVTSLTPTLIAGNPSIQSGTITGAAGTDVTGFRDVTATRNVTAGGSLIGVGSFVTGNSVVQGGISVTGTANTGALTSSSVTTSLVQTGAQNISYGGALDMGYGAPGRENNAGKIAYGTYSGSTNLDIVGGGNSVGNRVVQVFDALYCNAWLDTTSRTNVYAYDGGVSVADFNSSGGNFKWTVSAAFNYYNNATGILSGPSSGNSVFNALTVPITVQANFSTVWVQNGSGTRGIEIYYSNGGSPLYLAGDYRTAPASFSCNHSVSVSFRLQPGEGFKYIIWQDSGTTLTAYNRVTCTVI